MKTLLISGTDTDAGKTILTTSLIAYCQNFLRYKSLGVMKLLQTGVGDSELYERLFNGDRSVKIITPLRFDAPLAPPIAAAKEGKTVELEKVWQALNLLQQEQEFTFIEALGGLGTPVTDELTVADLARDWRLPTILVVPVKLGAICQTVANVALARQYNIDIKGIVLNCIHSDSEQNLEDWASRDLVQSLTNLPVLGVIPYLFDPSDRKKLALVASNLDLELFLPQ